MRLLVDSVLVEQLLHKATHPQARSLGLANCLPTPTAVSSHLLLAVTPNFESAVVGTGYPWQYFLQDPYPLSATSLSGASASFDGCCTARAPRLGRNYPGRASSADCFPTVVDWLQLSLAGWHGLPLAFSVGSMGCMMVGFANTCRCSFWPARHSTADIRSCNLDQRRDGRPFGLSLLQFSNFDQILPLVICGGDCLQRSAFVDAISSSAT